MLLQKLLHITVEGDLVKLLLVTHVVARNKITLGFGLDFSSVKQVLIEASFHKHVGIGD